MLYLSSRRSISCHGLPPQTELKTLQKASLFAVGAIKTGTEKFKEGIDDIINNDMISKGEATVAETKEKAVETKDKALNFAKSTGENIKDGFENLLDVGCGTGRMIELLASEMPGKRYTGLDLTPRMIEVANAKCVLEVLDVEPDPGPKVPQGNKPMVLM